MKLDFKSITIYQDCLNLMRCEKPQFRLFWKRLPDNEIGYEYWSEANNIPADIVGRQLYLSWPVWLRSEGAEISFQISGGQKKFPCDATPSMTFTNNTQIRPNEVHIALSDSDQPLLLKFSGKCFNVIVQISDHSNKKIWRLS
ncbi:hypothetical protein WR25_20252 [Diploscapter pachys]|uniref:C2 domain-containing protein n=1 Tax=Diploscapter pachys TaxID=2018661 RepID=A0A2A2LP32_9BILA|nr:hypothetical protein WR25_20252 [Diploscapter pachys]